LGFLVSLERTFLYARYSFNSLLDYEISKRILDITDLRNSLYEVNQKAFIDLILYSALSIESFLNKIGRLQLKDDFNERNKTKEKLKEIYKSINGKTLAFGKDYSSFISLFNYRSLLAHDKPMINSNGDLEDKYCLTPKETYEVLIFIDNLFANYKYENHKFYLVADIQRDLFKHLYSKAIYDVDDSLPFNKIKYPTPELYKYFIETKTGEQITVDVDANKIFPVS